MGISKQLAFFFLFLVTLTSGAQNYPPTFRAVKTSSAGRNEFGYVRHVAGDAFGNVYWAGSYTGQTFSLGAMTVTNHTGSGEFQGFLFKLGSNMEGIWAMSTSNGLNQEVTGLAVDAVGNVHIAITGWRGFFNFDGLSYTSPSNWLTVVLKYSPNGERIWDKPIHGLMAHFDNRIVDVDMAGNVFVAGVSEDDRSLLQKLNSDGETIWIRHGSAIRADFNLMVRTDPEGNCFFLSSFTNTTASFGSTTLSNTGSRNYAFVKYDADGEVKWADRGGGSSIYEDWWAADCPVDFAIDENGNSYVLSQIISTNAIFGELTFQLEPDYAIFFLTKYSPTGQAQWAKAFSTDYTYHSGGVSMRPNGNILFNPSGQYRSGSLSAAFLGECTPDGEVLWQKRVRIEPENPVEEHQRGGLIWTSRMVADRANNLYVAGRNTDIPAYLGLDSFILISPPEDFIAKLSFDPRLLTSITGNMLTLSWPTNEQGFSLESAIVFNEPITWEPVTNSVASTNGQNVISGLPVEGSRFYRLRKTAP